MRKFIASMALLMVAVASMAQISFKVAQKKVSPTEFDIVFTGSIASGWHVYAITEKNGPCPASFNVDKKQGVELVGGMKAAKAPLKKFDPLFGADLQFYEGSCTFTQRVRITGKDYSIEGYLEYGACNEQNCLPPTPVDFKFQGKAEAAPATPTAPAADAKADAKAADGNADALLTQSETVAPDAAQLENVADTAATDTAAVAGGGSVPGGSDLWKPVISELENFGDSNASGSDHGLLMIFVMGFLGGLIALLTPCVWPIIPMTVSFFLKRSKDDRKKGIKDAVTYGVSIVVIYLILGLAVTLILGPSALNALSTNAVFNIFFCLLLVVFGASFLGGFEITLPSSWNNAVDQKASSTTGLLSIFLMAFTLVLVSFSCTGPIIGFLLVEMATSGAILGPAVGMFGFALALALPFTLFAVFPTWLKSAPKSGNWMNVIKVTLGFVELAFSLKFLSVADLAYGWHILDREVFLSIWIVLFALLGAYLIGWIRFPHDEDEYDDMGNVVVNPRTSVIRFFVAIASFAFAIYMVPGLWGAPCKAVSAFAPPMNTQDFNLAKTEGVEGKYRDYEEGMRAAKAAGKPVMIDFTGFGCVNCRKMEAAVWTDETVKKHITEDYVLIQLFVDDKTPLPEPIEVTENGQTRKLRTVGDKWSYLERTKFGPNTQPLYVLLDNEGHPLNITASYDEDIQKYIKFLETGLENYSKK